MTSPKTPIGAATTASASVPPSKAAPMGHISVAVANIKSNPLMPLVYVDHDMALAAKPAPDVVMAQEIAPPTYKARFRRFFGPGRRIAGIRREVPIAYPSRWKTVAAWSKRRHLGIPHITPNRYDVIVKAITVDGIRVALLNTHMISEAWTHNDKTTKLRRALWRRHHKRTHKAVARLRDAGYSVILAGDLNHPGSVSFGPKQHDVYVAGLLQLSVLPAPGVRLAAEPTTRKAAGKVHTDHPILIASIELEVAA